MSRPSVLSDEEVQRYQRDGFVVPEFRLCDEVVGRLRVATDQLVADRPELVDHSIVGPHLPGGGMHGLRTDGTFLDIATDPALLDAVEQVMGPDLILWNSLVLYKRAATGPKVPWHRDAFGSVIDPTATTSVWIAVSESTTDNGCLRFIPGSHRTDAAGDHDATPRPNEMFSASLDPQTFDDATAVDAELEPGQIVLFDVFTIHGSQPNKAGRPRAGYSCRYMPGTSVYRHDSVEVRNQPGYGHESRALMLVRGQDRTGSNDFERGHARITA
jgi:hypothetical protein